ncbi:hypothetical protein BBP40_006676 [Aspergillus hancockii]|nr:hypothetical protein BBP40_006676 [Aspergillus hancockii]
MFYPMIQNILADRTGGVSLPVEYPAASDQNTTSGEDFVVEIIAKGLYHCPDQKYALFGYSQGATLMLNVLAQLNTSALDSIKSVILIGNPYRVPGKTSNVNATAQHDENASVGMFAAHAIASNSTIPQLSREVDQSGRVLDYCLECDELRPTCSNCSRRDSHCEYDSVSPFLWVHGTADRQQSMTGVATSHQQSGSVSADGSNLMLPRRCHSLETTAVLPTNLNLIDLELLMHWKDTTYQIFCRNPHTRPIWQSFVPQEGLKEPFLMHGILALSAVHLARAKGENLKPTYISTAVSHQNHALTIFRPSLDNITESNSKALFAFSSIVTVYSFAFPQAPGSLDPRMTVDDLCQVIVFARGVHQILVHAADYLQDSTFKPLLQWDDLEQKLTEEAGLAFKELRKAIHVLGAENTRHSYLTTIDCIQDSLAEILGGFRAVAAATRIAIRMPPMYITLLREYDSLALVILCYYCAVLHRLRHNWCLEERGARIARALWFILGGEWRHLMHWAMQDIFGPDFLTRLKETI